MFVTPFLIGLAGSLHCIGMCGPLAAVANGGKNVVYNIGRIFTYGVLGSLVSIIGTGLNMIGVQQWVSIVLGICILVVAIANIHLVAPSFVVKFIVHLRSKFKLRPIFSGMINGLLPCGMTLVALGYCTTVNGPLEGFSSMIIFGLGTLPAMLSFSLIAKSITRKLPNIQTALMIVSAIILIGRGVYVTAHEIHPGIVVCGATSQHSIE
ncbi:MAG: sulfite exporter TauE/SafE family protein [Bacteroidota bacterium]